MYGLVVDAPATLYGSDDQRRHPRHDSTTGTNGLGRCHAGTDTRSGSRPPTVSDALAGPCKQGLQGGVDQLKSFAAAWLAGR